jgi:hypothetical protein
MQKPREWAVHTYQIDNRAEFLEWAEHRSEKIVCYTFNADAGSKLLLPEAGQMELRHAILDALIEVYERMAAGE